LYKSVTLNHTFVLTNEDICVYNVRFLMQPLMLTYPKKSIYVICMVWSFWINIHLNPGQEFSLTLQLERSPRAKWVYFLSSSLISTE